MGLGVGVSDISEEDGAGVIGVEDIDGAVEGLADMVVLGAGFEWG